MKSLEIVNICLEELLNNKTEICEYDLLEIKQDLEVLEILRKHLWVEDDYVCLSDYLNNNYYEEHFHKVKQWLEENEDDN